MTWDSQRIMRDQPDMIRQRACAGSANEASATMEYGGVTTMSASPNASERRKITRYDPLLLAQRSRHGGQVGIDPRRFREMPFHMRLLALAGENQNRLGTHGRRGLP